jgi:hypothetical protein
MASRENLFNTGINMGRLAVAGAVLYVGAQQIDGASQNPDINQSPVLRGQILTSEEVGGLRNYEVLMAKSARIEPTVIPIADLALVPTPEPETQKMEMMSVAPMTAEQAQRIEKYKEELPNILMKLNADPQQTEDLKMYYPIYRAAQDKSGVPWYLTWIVHEDESSASRNANAFILGSGHYGAMQRAVEFHPDSDIERASAGYSFLKDLPQLHPDDWREIVWGAEALSEYIQSSGSTLGGLERYSAAGPAQTRYGKYLRAENIFE